MSEQIVTVSLNPAINAILWMDTLSAEQENRVKRERMEPSGGALNVSRVLSGLQIPNLAVGAYGEDNGLQLMRLMDRFGIQHEFVSCKGETKQDITMMLPKNTVIKTTRTGFQIGVSSLRQIQQKIVNYSEENRENILVFSGEQPHGMAISELTRFIQNSCAGKARLVLNIPGFTIEELKTLHPFVTMIRIQELKAITRVNFRNETTMLRCMKSMTGELEHIIVNLGARGFLYTGKEESYRIIQPQNRMLHPENSDYFLAGFLCGLQRGLPLQETLMLAGGCAAWLTLGDETAFSEAAASIGRQKIMLEKML